MHIEDHFAEQATISSFEFFPPTTERGAEKLFETIRRLEALKPFFVSVTYGAGGSTRDITWCGTGSVTGAVKIGSRYGFATIG